MSDLDRGAVGEATTRAAARILLLVVVALAVVSSAPRAGAQPATSPTTSVPPSTAPPSPAAPSDTGDLDDLPTEPGLWLVAQSPWTAPSGLFELEVLPRDLPPGTTLEVEVHPAVTGRIDFDRATRDEGLDTPLSPGPAPIDLATAPRTAAGAVAVTIPIVPTGPVPEGGLLLSRSGVHPVVVRALAPDGDELDRLSTNLVRLPTAEDQGVALAVGTVVRVGGTSRPSLDGDAPVLDPAERDQALDVIDALTGHPTVALSLGAIPSVLTALQADASGTNAVSSLAASLAGRQVLASPYVDLDTGAWVAAGLDPEFLAQLTTGAQLTTTVLGVTPDGRTTVADPTVTLEALALLRGLGLEQIVVPADQLVDPPATDLTFTETFEVADADGQTVTAITADADLGDRLTATDDPVLNAHLALADMAVLYNDAPARSRGVALDLGADVDPTTLATLLAALAAPVPAGSEARAVVSPVTLDDLFRVTEMATVESQSRSTNLVIGYRSAPSGPLGDYPSRLRATERQLSGYRSLTALAPGTTAPLDQAVALSGAVGLSAAERNAVLDAVNERIDADVAQVVAPLQQFVTLTSRSGKIPLNLENRLPIPVLVHVVLDSVKLEFPAGNLIEVELPAASTTRLDVEVTTRASGAFPLEVNVRSPDEVLRIADTSFTVRSTAISGVGLVLSVGAGAFLLLWWGRHWRKVRRARQLVAADGTALGTSAPGPD